MKTRRYQTSWTEDRHLMINGLSHFCTRSGKFCNGAVALLTCLDSDFNRNEFGLYYSYQEQFEDGHVEMRFDPVFDPAMNHIILVGDNLYEVPFACAIQKYDSLLKSLVCYIFFNYK